MKLAAIARNYSRLTPEERFRLILAADARGDDAERDRLTSAGQRLPLTIPDHAPYLYAFRELAVAVFVELLEDAARYLEFLERAERLSADSARAQRSHDRVNETSEDEGDGSCREPFWDVALANGFILRTKLDGWTNFCERLAFPPLLLWRELPGFDRLERALRLTEIAAFTAEQCVQWMNGVRRTDEPTTVEDLLNAPEMTASIEETFRQSVAWWSGENVPAARC